MTHFRGTMVVLGCVCACLAFTSAAQGTLLNYWSFNNSGDVGEATVGTDLTAAGNAQYSAGGYSGGGLLVDGSGDYLGGSPTVPTGNSAYTTVAWIKPDVTGGRGIVGWGNYGSGRRVNALRLNGDNGFRHYWWGADIDRDAAVAGVDIDDGSWHHVVASYNGSTRSLYVDGKPIGSDAPGVNNATAANFRIASTNNGEWFDGTIDDVATYDHALSGNQIRALAAGTSTPPALPAADPLVGHWVADDYAGGNWTDRVASIPAQIESDPSQVGGQLNGHAVVRFDGNDAFRVLAGDSPMANAGDFTVATIFRTTTPGAGGAGQWYQNTGLVDMELPGGTNDWGLVYNGSGQVGAGLGGPDQTRYSTETGLNDGTAHVAVYTRQGGTASLYIDGGAAQVITGAGTTERRPNQFTIGRRQTGGNFYTGDLAEVLLYDGTLTPAEAAALAGSLATTYGLRGPKNWTNPGTGPWQTGGNWSGGTVPNGVNDATIDNGGTAQLGSGTATAGSLTIGGGGGGGGTLAWTGGSLDTLDIAVGTGGALDRSGYAAHWAYGGQLTVSGNGQVLMPAAGSEIQLNDGASMGLSGTAVVSNFHAVIVGNAGDTNTMQTLTVADTAQMTGINYIVVGKSGRKGQVIQSGGTVTATNLYLGEYASSEGQYQLSGGGDLTVDQLLIGKEAVGTFTLSDGQVNVNGPVLRVGESGTGTLTQTGGSVKTANWCVIGQTGDKTSTYNMSGGTLGVNTNGGGEKFQIGVSGTAKGILNLSGDAAVTVNNSQLQIGGDNTTASGTVTQGGTSRLTGLNGAQIAVGYNGPGTYTLKDSATLTADNMVLASGGASTGTFHLQGGTLEVTNIAKGAGTAQFNFTGGTLDSNLVDLGGQPLVNNGGRIEIRALPGLARRWYDGNAPTDTAPPESWNPASTPLWDTDTDNDTAWGGGDQPPAGIPGGNWDYYTVIYDGQVHVPASGNVSFREQIDDSTVLYVDGVRRLWDYTPGSDMGEPTGDPWTVHATTTFHLDAGWHDLEIRFGDHWGGQGGVLQWDPNGGSSWQTISGASLRMDGPASEIGVMTVLDDVTLNGGTLAMDVDADLDIADKLIVSGLLTLGGELELSVIAGTPQLGDMFDLLDFGSMAGAFDTMDLASLPAGLGWDTSMLYTDGTISVVERQAGDIPEPVTVLATLVGLSALCGYVRRKRT